MVSATTPPPEPSVEPRSLVELQGRYHELIHRYVRRRVPDPSQAERIVREVFQKAGAHPAQVQANPLPWLIAAARRACAQSRHATILRSSPPPAAGPPTSPHTPEAPLATRLESGTGCYGGGAVLLPDAMARRAGGTTG
jgi:DNA-directed RNA polymerase specialized sigma24 family protein